MTEERPTVTDMAKAYALDAIDHAKSKCDIDLDYSPESIPLVETILGQLHDGMPKGFLAKFFGFGPSRTDIETVAKMYGFYVGEVIRRCAGGEWQLEDDGVALTKDEAKICPPAKVFQRITDGDGDNVAAYFKVLINEYWPTDAS